MRSLSLTAILLASAALAQTTTPAPATAPARPAAALTFTPVPYLSAAPVRTFKEAVWVVNPARTYRAILKTGKGDVTVELYAKQAPKAVNSFVFLALNRFYDGTRFHRVIESFMAQGGDPLSADAAQRARWGTGGPGYQFYLELDPALTFNAAGVLGMARSQSPFSQGSQFFITLAPADFLTGEYTVFGRVVTGQDVLQKLTRTMNQNNQDIEGAQPDLIQSVQILVSR